MMTNERVRRDLDAADAIVRASWDNFVATEPTYVLRDLIAIELDKARKAEREACAKIADEWAATSDRLELKVASVSSHYCNRIAAAIRARSTPDAKGARDGVVSQFEIS